MISGSIGAAAPGELARPLVDAAGTAGAPRAATSIPAGFSINGAIAVFITIAVIALIVVTVFGVRSRRAGGLRSAHSEEIKRAAAADVAAIEEDDEFFRPDAPGRQEDDL
jgi:hypothetical protein